MAIVTVRQFAEMCGVEPKSIETWITRSKVSLKPGKAKRIDTNNPVNADFMRKRKADAAKKSDKLPPKEASKSQPIAKNAGKHFETTEFNLQQQLEFDEEARMQNARDQLRVDLAYQLQETQLQKAKLDVEHKELLLNKAAGELLPVDLVRGIVTRHATSFIKSFERGSETIATLFCSIMAAGDTSMYPRIVGQMKTLLSECIGKAGAAAEEEIKILVDDYSQTNYRGQKKI